MDPLTSLILTLTMGAVFLYALYGVVKKAVSAGVKDALEKHVGESAKKTSGNENPLDPLDD